MLSSGQMLLAELHGDGPETFYPSHFLTWQAAPPLQHADGADGASELVRY